MPPAARRCRAASKRAVRLPPTWLALALTVQRRCCGTEVITALWRAHHEACQTPCPPRPAAGEGGNALLNERKQVKDQKLVRGNKALVGNIQVGWWGRQPLTAWPAGRAKQWATPGVGCQDVCRRERAWLQGEEPCWNWSSPRADAAGAEFGTHAANVAVLRTRVSHDGGRAAGCRL